MKQNTIQGQIIRPFSPAIGKYKLSEETINILNNHIDEILKDENKIAIMLMSHSSEIRGLCLMKLSSERLQKLPYFLSKKSK